MNRKIEVRGKSIYNGEWVYGSGIVSVEVNTRSTNRLVIVKTVQYDELDYFYPKFHDSTEVVPETLGQFTGQLDRNNKKIYEGDIVMYMKKLYVVYWNDESALYSTRSLNGDVNIYPGMNIGTTRFMEVVGNVHGNKDLLIGEVHD